MLLKTKSLLSPIVTVLILSSVSMFSFYSIHLDIEEITVREIPKLQAALEMEININEASEEFYKIIHQEEGSLKKSERFYDSIEDYHNFSKQYLALTRTTEEKQILDEITLKIDSYFSLSKNIFDVHDQQIEKIIERRYVLNERIEAILDNDLQQNLDSNQADSIKKQEALLEIEINVHELISAVRGYLLKHDDFLIERMVDSRNDLKKWLQTYSTMKLDRREQFKLQEMSGLFDKVKQLSTDIIELEGRKINLLKQHERLLTILDNLMDEKIQAINLRLIEQDQRQIFNTMGSVFISIIFFSLAAILWGWYLSKKIIDPINILIKNSKYIGTSKFQPITKIEDDEIGLLTQQLNDANDIIIHRTDELVVAKNKLEALSYQDGLTQISNRRHFDIKLNEEWKRSIRSQLPLTLIMIDIDYFKDFNDRYGHLEGDDCLKKVSTILSNNTQRSSDTTARYGGEEFALIIPDTEFNGGFTIAENIHMNIANAAIRHEGSKVSQFVTVSIGLATFNKTENYNSALELVNLVDDLLYKAKNEGRNCTSASEID